MDKSTTGTVCIDLGNGHVAIVDAQDADASLLPWRLHRGAGGHVYAAYRDRHRKCVLLHRHLMKPRANEVVDHINNNGLDNRRSNLRVCTAAQNLHNRLGWRNAKVPFKGVTQAGKRFRASIMCQGERHHLGIFDTAEDASTAYNKAAERFHGDFARFDSHGVFFTPASLSHAVPQRGNTGYKP